METLVQFRNRAGKWLRGMVHRPSAARARQQEGLPGVVFLHGFTGDRMESHWIFVKCARSLAEAGVASLRFDFYGSGESEGEFREVTLQSELDDAQVAVEFFRRQKGVNPGHVGLCGLSLGGTIAATIADRVKARALVLWSALAHPSHLRTLAEITTKPIPDGSGDCEYSGHEISRQFLERVDEIEPLKSIRRFKGPTLIIHPEKDEYLPLLHAEDYFRATSAAVKEKVIIPGADHVYCGLSWERQVIERTVGWFRQHLFEDDQ